MCLSSEIGLHRKRYYTIYYICEYVIDQRGNYLFTCTSMNLQSVHDYEFIFDMK